MKLLWAIVLATSTGVFFSSALAAPKAAKTYAYEKDIKPLLVKYCYDCHGDGMKKGGLALDKFKDETAAIADRNTWEMVLENVHSHVMPPQKKKQPSQAERDLITGWIDMAVFKCDCEHPDP